MKYYVCYNETLKKYYSKLYGWVDYILADHYTDYEARNSQPPGGGCWINTDRIVDGVVYFQS